MSSSALGVVIPIALALCPADSNTGLAAVQSPEAGAVVLFLGTTRAVTDGRETASLDYDCYAEMAEKKLAQLESEAREKGHEVVVGQFPFAASGRAMSLLETEGFVKIVGDAKTDEVLGVQMVGPEVTELIAEATLAIEMGATVEDVARTIHAHPTLPEAMMEASEAVHKMAVHIFQKR